jgi:hypothetical protein
LEVFSVQLLQQRRRSQRRRRRRSLCFHHLAGVGSEATRVVVDMCDNALKSVH